MKYRVWNSSTREWSRPLGLYFARRKAHQWLKNHGPFRFYGEADHTLTLPEALKKLTNHMKKGHIRDLWEIRSAFGSSKRRVVVRKVEVLEALKGEAVVRFGLSQLGVEYKWAWEDPRGDGDGTEGFDCSGLTAWAYAQVGIHLDHMADAQYQDTQVHKFWNSALILPGDLVFYHTGRLPAGHADHVGIATSRTEVCDASSYYGRVVHRPITSNPIMAYGRVTFVNGPI